VITDEESYYIDRLTNYGSLFIGPETTVAYGDKTIGTNHILPTSRAARYTGGLWVGKFLKTCTYQRCTPAASIAIAEVCERQCNAERMYAHAITARIRIDRYANNERVASGSAGVSQDSAGPSIEQSETALPPTFTSVLRRGESTV
jgi:sulfopropanediol 3-dehydrogenase